MYMDVQYLLCYTVELVYSLSLSSTTLYCLYANTGMLHATATSPVEHLFSQQKDSLIRFSIFALFHQTEHRRPLGSTIRVLTSTANSQRNPPLCIIVALQLQIPH
jgi:hypothetical protein